MNTSDPGPPGDEATATRAADRLLGVYENRVLAALPTVDPDPFDSPLGHQPGDLIGPYTLVEHLADGGMGEVWKAERKDPFRLTVALKIIKAGMDTREVVARFEVERKALALMDHPYISRVFDGGATKAGRPYFVMELVEGLPIATFCDRACLPTRDRLALFIKVCEAVQHAHQRGIIHRDLKPGNILVATHDSEPFPKVIDFGIAKATSQELTVRTLFTEFGRIVGTLAYMAPEQAEFNNDDVDTRADLYSLGCLLYELLTGTPPFEEAELRRMPFDQVCQTIRQTDPAKPSTKLTSLDPQQLAILAAHLSTVPKKLRKAFRGDLDHIVQKALQKDRSHRYQTANGLALDVQRYLNQEPVSATAPSRLYKARTFARKHRGPLLAAATVALTVLVAAAWSVAMALREAEQRSARNQEEYLRHQAEYEPRIFAALNKTQVRQFTLQHATIGANWIKLSGFVRRTDAERIAKDGVALTEKGIAELQEIARIVPERPDAHYHRARAQYLLRMSDEAVASLDTALTIDPGFAPAFYLRTTILNAMEHEEIRQQDLRRFTPSAPWGKNWLSAYLALESGAWANAEAELSALLAHVASGEKMYAAAPYDFYLLRGVARIGFEDYYGAIEDFAKAQGQWPEALSPGILLGKAYHLAGDSETAVQRFQATYANARFKDEVALGVAALYFWRLGDKARSLEWTEQIQDPLLRERNRAQLYNMMLRPSEGVVAARNAIAIDPADDLSHFYLGCCLRKMGKTREAAESFQTVISLRDASDFLLAHLELAECLRELDQPAQALEHYCKAIRASPSYPFPYHGLLRLARDTAVSDPDGGLRNLLVELSLRKTEVLRITGDGMMRVAQDTSLLQLYAALDQIHQRSPPPKPPPDTQRRLSSELASLNRDLHALRTSSPDPSAWRQEKELLLKKRYLLGQLERQEERDLVQAELTRIPNRPAGLGPQQIDLTAQYNASPYYPYSWALGSGMAMRFVAEQLPKRCDRTYDVRGIIQLNSGPYLKLSEFRGRDLNAFLESTYPDHVTIPINLTAQSLFLLGACCWGTARPDEVVANVKLNYSDATSAELPLRSGRHLGEWMFGAELPLCTIAWRGQNDQALYEIPLQNPHPEKLISTIDLVSAKTASAPFFLAITLE